MIRAVEVGQVWTRNSGHEAHQVVAVGGGEVTTLAPDGILYTWAGGAWHKRFTFKPLIQIKWEDRRDGKVWRVERESVYGRLSLAYGGKTWDIDTLEFRKNFRHRLRKKPMRPEIGQVWRPRVGDHASYRVRDIADDAVWLSEEHDPHTDYKVPTQLLLDHYEPDPTPIRVGQSWMDKDGTTWTVVGSHEKVIIVETQERVTADDLRANYRLIK